ncbi:Cyclin_N domain-containing protein/Cyclin_C domain-containing protein, partial [Cephalotus follicularis]
RFAHKLTPPFELENTHSPPPPSHPSLSLSLIKKHKNLKSLETAMKIKLSRGKQMMEPAGQYIKKLRSKRPRPVRTRFSPVLKNATDESSRAPPESNDMKRQFGEIHGNEKIQNSPFRRITRSYYKQMKNERREHDNEVAEVSESSCVESISGAVFGERSFKRKRNSEGSGIVKDFEVSDISCVEQVSGARNLNLSPESKENDVVSFTSGVDSRSEAKFESLTRESEKREQLEFETFEISRNEVVSFNASFSESDSDFVVDQRPRKSFEDDSNLACAEQFSYGDESEYSSSHRTLCSELQSDYFSDYSPSSFFDSGSEFSDKSIADSTPSLTHSMLLEYRLQFSRSTSPQDTRSASHTEEEYHDPSTLVRFESEDDEESYMMLRERERRQVSLLHDYAEEYLSTTEYGDLILQQRSLMVHWIIEQCNAKEFQQETMFLGVHLLDRFLSKGFFKTKRNLQIVGVACLALATRIEENQPYNSLRQKNFYIGSDTYRRYEVVAMEWLVQEVLNFQCFMPTIYNFLWYYLKAAKADADVEKRAKYLAMLTLPDHEHLCYWSSTVAAGLVILACLESNRDGTYQQVIEIHVRKEFNDLPECIKSLEWSLQYVS